MKLFGTTTINPIIFYIGKLSFVGNFVFLFLGGFVNAYKFSPIILIADLIFLFIPALIIFFISMLQLGDSLRVGLPNEETKLKTHGLYKISRNPIYLSVFMFSIASCIYVPHWLNILFLLLVVVIHHQIIKGEEAFLKEKFKGQWDEYTKKVRRYL